MLGQITKYFHDREYGFLMGEDGQNYYFTPSDFKTSFPYEPLGFLVEFSPHETTRGLSAQEISSTDRELLYEVPRHVLMSEGKTVKGWKIIYKADFSIKTSSPISKKKAQEELFRLAIGLNANALIDGEYYVKRISSPGLGFNKYKRTHETIHHLEATPAFVAKKSIFGTLQKSDMDINSKPIQSEIIAEINKQISQQKCIPITPAKTGRSWFKHLTVYVGFFVVISLIVFGILMTNYSSINKETAIVTIPGPELSDEAKKIRDERIGRLNKLEQEHRSRFPADR